ncbi:hypothetical protein BB559_006120 [Furculomyces boomerangus]|uniref:Enoyl reductase (ER) domain-containing protein n=2 Tax=Harpellales TaxID=61421 RepID=A0A2T9Y4N6_9FUNG|nr:hypothetical protein BB559_006400 [Furculomyces boomerangus]PVU87300.1 hypothetical protein BB559_006120 [Furculomyces boomerangus]PVZ96630.1 hypothetical protein BB558_007454 [Smittium angustum]
MYQLKSNIKNINSILNAEKISTQTVRKRMENNMKALVFDQYGTTENLHYRDVPTPTPKDNEVLIKVHSVSVNAGDILLLSGLHYLARLATGIFRPRINILGHDLSGTIASIGPKVTEFKVGDNVFGAVPMLNAGSFADYAKVPSDHIIKKPENMSFNDAAAFPIAALTAIQAIKYNIKPNSENKVLVYGASGGVGSFAVQVARALGCDVTAVCSSRNSEAAKILGANRVIDYKTESVFDKSEKYDLVFAANGDNSIFSYKGLLDKNGVYVTSGGSLKQMAGAMALGPFILSNKMSFLSVKPNRLDLEYLCNLYNDGKLVSVIDKVYPKDQLIDAIKYFEKGQARGKVIIDFTK